MYKLVWRNVWRHRRRTWLTVTAIATALSLLSVMMCMQEGTYAHMIRRATHLWYGVLQIQHAQYADEPSLYHSFRITPAISRLLDMTADAWSPRIVHHGLVSLGQETRGGKIVGIDPQREWTWIRHALERGRWLRTSGEALLGSGLAQSLGATPDSEIAVLVQARDGSIGARLFRVVGIFRVHMPDLDRSGVLIHRDAADDLCVMRGRVTTVVLRVPMKQMDTIRRNLRAALHAQGMRDLTVRAWSELVPEMVQAIETDRVSGWLYYGVLLVVVGFGMLNTLYMSIYERNKEIGILRAIGMTRRRLLTMIGGEAAVLACIGVITGLAIGVPVILYLQAHPIRLGGELAKLYESFMFEPAIYTRLDSHVLMRLSGLVIGFALISAVFPAWHTLRLALPDLLKFQK